MTVVIREYEVRLTVRVALSEPLYGKGKPPYKPAFTPTTTEVSEAIVEILTMEESAIVQRPSNERGRRFDPDLVHLDIESVERNVAASGRPGVLDEIRDAELKRRRQQDDIAKHAEQRSVETEEKERDA